MSARGILRLAPLAALLWASAAYADHPFVLPSNTAYSGDNPIATFDAAGADHVFFFDHRPLQLSSIAITAPDGTPAQPFNTLQSRYRSSFDLKLDQQGTWKIASVQAMITGSFKQNGEERRVGGRPGGGGPGGPGGPGAGRPAGGPGPAPGGEPRRQPPVAFEDIPADATDVRLTEVIGRAETFVSAGAPTTGALKPTGKGIELDPVTHPNEVVAGETAKFRFLIDGKPAPGLDVTVIPGGDRYRDDAGEVTLKTGADGVVAIKWPAAGMYWVGTEAEDKAPSEKRAEARRMSYSATLEVVTP
ncbi:DUF4198 domain-containing protein [Sphingomonas immobilis]|uniref:DUF4198 domain-containing protein n=1 Tax=Sphingomonas immobilis TaxID=3063997 RepID=A0ABT9A593_9SPHN|nr:DUF4198 domain-containing protein [Sphingomonas sp. CA1-15]MDO7844131.1 DUF4198 domain-containing protein [Sphingomonas sp. CA1-15]